jgi:protein phosphatase
MVDRGLITADKAKRHAIKNVITRALGEADLVQVDLLERQIEDGDLMILCSDGVSNGMDGPRMLEIARGERGIRDICLKLVAEAGEKYGADNATAIVVRTTVTGRPKPSAGPPGWYRPKTLPLDGAAAGDRRSSVT